MYCYKIEKMPVYAAGIHVSTLSTRGGLSASEIQENSALFSSIFQSEEEEHMNFAEKSLRIVLVRDVDGKTFWDALDEGIIPIIKEVTSADKSALKTFRSIFQGRPLKKETSIFFTCLDTSKMLAIFLHVCVSSDGNLSSLDATTESENGTSAIFDDCTLSYCQGHTLPSFVRQLPSPVPSFNISTTSNAAYCDVERYILSFGHLSMPRQPG
ncbi:hypothetical protein SADUNF_Sadunf16G0250500 [Salix dunnii]|uniref:Chalcone-flavonone isomerase family protein n=1 Tax=Salix dunnii TaxID=1413687 RepID=A0A835JBY4_9ROSI|nr:hypothetical protein SADUNF_Sadunf16G0250500 [Salix dunnii]